MDVMTVDEIAAELRISLSTVYGWLDSGQLVGYKVGNLWRIKRSDFDAFMAAGRNVQGMGDAP